MVAEHQEAQRSYQRALRVIGRYIDNDQAVNVSIAEVQDGFTVRSHPTRKRSDEVVRHFEWDRLGDLDLFYSGGRGVGRRASRRTNDAGKFPCGHEAALRKLGSILDEEDANSLSIDEASDGLDVSYMRSSAGGQEKAQKVFTPAELCS